jgi:peptidoglycan-associated lipoprotein
VWVFAAKTLGERLAVGLLRDQAMRLVAIGALVVTLTGCATTTATRTASVDVAGRWTGTWLGYGVATVPRDEEITLELARSGTGRLLMASTLAADHVPDSVRDSGMAGVRIVFDVSGTRVRLIHELGSELFEAHLVLTDGRLVGHVLRSDPAVRLDLTREKPAAAIAPAAIVSVAAGPPPPPPRPVEPPRAAPPPAPALAEAAPPAPSRAPDEVPSRGAPPSTEFVAVRELRSIHFDFDRSDVRPADATILDANVEWLRAHPEALVLIEGHCDERGTAEYNLALGERRARSTMTYLVGRGIAEARITITSYGLERPVCTQRTEACRVRNRRASFLVRPR